MTKTESQLHELRIGKEMVTALQTEVLRDLPWALKKLADKSAGKGKTSHSAAVYMLKLREGGLSLEEQSYYQIFNAVETVHSQMTKDISQIQGVADQEISRLQMELTKVLIKFARAFNPQNGNLKLTNIIQFPQPR